MTERWLPVPGYEGLYDVSDEGRVRSLPRGSTAGRILRPWRMKNGYLAVGLSRPGNGPSVKTAYVHRLVLEAFVGTAPKGLEACHDNGDRTDARLCNLRWDTRTANAQDRWRHGTMRQKPEAVARGADKRHPHRHRAREEIMAWLRRDPTVSDYALAELVGVNRKTVAKVRTEASA